MFILLKIQLRIVGDYSYYDSKHGETFEDQVLYHYEVIGNRFIMGKFCCVASSVTFIMNGANHRIDGFTAYPFNILGHGWEKYTPSLSDLPLKGDTIIGSDVWIGMDATIMPGIKIGDGAIPSYTIVGGNPATEIKKRFSDDVINELLEIKWWDFDIKKFSSSIDIIVSEDIGALRKVKSS